MSGPIEEVSEFTYLGSLVSKTGGTEEDVKLKLGRARVAFRMMDKVWTSNVYSRRTKLRLQFKCEAIIVVWLRNLEIYKGTDQQNQVLINRSLRRITYIQLHKYIQLEFDSAALTK